MDQLWNIAQFMGGVAVIAAFIMVAGNCVLWIARRTKTAWYLASYIFLCRGKIWESELALRYAIDRAKRNSDAKENS